MRNGKSLGCFNMALWDFAAVALLAGYIAYHKYTVHPFFCLLIGAAAGILTVLLMRLPFLGFLLQIACGVFWSQILWNIGFHLHPTEDPIWIWGMQIVLAILCVALHFASVNEVLGPKEKYNFTELDFDEEAQRYDRVELLADSDEIQERFEELKESYLDACDDRDDIMQTAQELLEEPGTDTLYRLMRENDRIWTEGAAQMSVYVDMLQNAETYQEQKSAMKRAEQLLSKLQQISHAVLKESNQILSKAGQRTKRVEAKQEQTQREQTQSRIEEKLFAGCRDKESLTKRYRSLMKTFHPDNADGDTDMTIKVKATYESLLQQYE